MQDEPEARGAELRSLLGGGEKGEGLLSASSTSIAVASSSSGGGLVSFDESDNEHEDGAEKWDDDEFESEEELRTIDVAANSATVTAILRPVAVTMCLVVWLVRLIHTITVNVSIGLAYHEQQGDSPGQKLGGSLLNALVFVVMITLTTVLFVILYKYRCLKILFGWLIASTGLMLGMFGGSLLWMACVATNTSLDYVTVAVLLWNFTIVGVLSIFWHAPPSVNRAFLVCVSALMATFFTLLPEWTTWAILVAISLYDLAAVLCPYGPLRMLVETAQQRREPIPALLYNGSLTFMADGIDEDADEKEGGVKLGLGDFVFYSVLLGRAALFDMITVFTCFIAILTGLFGTLILLAIFQKALPALPFSIALAMLFFFLTRFFLLPYIVVLGVNGVFV
jgi:presenilin 1